MLKWRTPTRTCRICYRHLVRFPLLGWQEPGLKVLPEPPPRLVVAEVPTLPVTVMDQVVPPGLDTTAALELLRTGTDQGDQEVLVVPGVLEVHLEDLEDLVDLVDLVDLEDLVR